MTRNRFKYQWSERRIKFADDDSGDYDEDSDYDPEAYTETDLQGAFHEMEGEIWDNIEFYDGTIICYPADSHMDYRTGEYVDNTLFIKGVDKDLERLIKCHEHYYGKR